MPGKSTEFFEHEGNDEEQGEWSMRLLCDRDVAKSSHGVCVRNHPLVQEEVHGGVRLAFLKNARRQIWTNILKGVSRYKTTFMASLDVKTASVASMILSLTGVQGYVVAALLAEMKDVKSPAFFENCETEFRHSKCIRHGGSGVMEARGQKCFERRTRKNGGPEMETCFGGTYYSMTTKEVGLHGE